jgi:uncharacterized lipoprotein YajG
MRSLLVISFLLCGCSTPTTDTAAIPNSRFKQQRMDFTPNGVGVHILTDTQTGRQYLVVYNGGIVPLRFDYDEKSDCKCRQK